MFQNKTSLRKKAMDSMMKEGPSIALKKKPMIGQSEKPAEGEELNENGFVQMMVSPEEKEMLLSYREESTGEEQIPEEELEIPEEAMPEESMFKKKPSPKLGY